ERADHASLSNQRVTAIGSDAIGLTQLGAQVVRGASAGRLTVEDHAAAQDLPVVKLLKLPSFFLGHASERIEAQAARLPIEKEVEEKLAIKVGHRLPAEVFNGGIRIVALQELARDFGCQRIAASAPSQRILQPLDPGDIARSRQEASNAAPAVGQARHNDVPKSQLTLRRGTPLAKSALAHAVRCRHGYVYLLTRAL